MLLSPFALLARRWQILPFLHCERRCIPLRCVQVMPVSVYVLQCQSHGLVNIDEDLPLQFLFQSLLEKKCTLHQY